MSEITTVGIDLAKNVLSVHGVDGHGKTVLRKNLTRGKLLELMAQLPACRVGMEACSGAHGLSAPPLSTKTNPDLPPRCEGASLMR